MLPGGLRRLPVANVQRFRGRLRSMRDRLKAATLEPAEARARMTAWEAQASFAHTRRIRNAILGERQPRGRPLQG